ncbi:SGNH/GDSL hydrolase family protein [Bradyrhizobium diazoefficiens]|uniref:SGNH/GDSL hydrolase family protein n=1 Tax=Bradyrhizobium diazoefficiens TaxID=1355477 RepID=UPI00272B3CAB|nr:SGNH family hydrolase [Bradyrhizobium diazoefficiens]WLA66425.1 SGNH family hydrolase [Bradyrhizobium diazoefficiens]
MSKKSLFKALTETGPLIALGTALAILVSVAGPASAQFFNFPGFGGPPQRSAPPPRQGGGGGWFGGDFFAPFQQQQPQAPRQDFSRAPAPSKRDTIADKNVLVIGDAMADWLAYGLEDAYSEQPDMGVIRKHKTTSGLIKYQPKGEPSDWAAAAKGILETEKPDVIVVMLGLNDRISIREPVTEKSDKASDKDKKNDKGARAKPQGKPDAKPGDAKPDIAAKPDDKPADADLPQDDADNADAPQVAIPEKTARNPNGLYEFRDDRWVELYAKKIEELANVLKAKGVPVLWVGLPAIRGPKGTADMLFLDSLYREGAAKAGITYVDVWDGFVDEAGRFLQKGPDFEGQIRQLRTYDGVFFTKPGARKLAHYVEREITRLLAGRSGPIALPSEPATPDTSVEPGKPAPRPLAGPIVPLVAASISTDQLLGGPGSRPAAVDALAAKTMVKGEPLTAPAGRADDYAWPRREVGREQAKGDTPMATTTPDGGAAAPGAAAAAIAPPKLAPKKPPVVQQPAQATPSFRDFFGFGSPQPAPRQLAPAPGPRNPAQNPAIPRPPGNVGRSAEVIR